VTQEQPVTSRMTIPQKQRPVRDPRTMTSQRMGLRRRRDQGLRRSPDGIKHFGLECAHDNEVLHLVVGCWVALGIKPEPTRRPVDGHLSARPLSARSLPRSHRMVKILQFTSDMGQSNDATEVRLGSLAE